MPELPEVETVVRDLRPALIGRRLVHVTVSRKQLRIPWLPSWKQALTGQSVLALNRRGKWIAIVCERGCLLIHLGMTGQLTAGKADRVRESHTHWIADLDNGDQLRFRDIRRFGSATYFSAEDEMNRFLAQRLGPEPFEIESPSFRIAMRSSHRSLKALLLDQTIVAGVGNIYADESLFAARLSPRQLGSDTTGSECDRLRRAVVRVLEAAIEFRGSTIRNYVGGSGLRGSYQDEFRVYGRGGKPCRRCRASIAVIRLAGRSTHFCPACQEPSSDSSRQSRAVGFAPV